MPANANPTPTEDINTLYFPKERLIVFDNHPKASISVGDKSFSVTGLVHKTALVTLHHSCGTSYCVIPLGETNNKPVTG
ncbi:hypothetical protein KIN20_027258 [Parelaphostrongylus tenuis]|uniref:Uncharacterized protein n=1 Tax=Parelaphostrongylus tenuis TaxID=148309 RepID=A0AAD5QZ39_PARTN|nr:hypothetical protein KIN20_027258 [Parelaphostrongylus tenuis]